MAAVEVVIRGYRVAYLQTGDGGADCDDFTGDLMADPAALMRYTKEIDEAAAMKPFLAYRRDKNFRWRYLDWLKPKP